MKSAQWLIAAIGVFLGLPAHAADCAAVDARAQIVRLESPRPAAVRIERRNGDNVPATPYAYLCPGDTVLVTEAGARAWIRSAGKDNPTQVDSTRRRFLIAEEPDFAPIAWMAEQWNRLERVLGDTGAPAVTASLSLSRLYGSEPNGPAKPFASHPLLASREQFMPRDAALLALAWNGKASKVVLVDAEGDVIESEIALGPSAKILKSPPLDRIAAISIVPRDKGEVVTYAIAPVDTATIPAPFQLAGNLDLSSSQRLGRALWLLNEGPLQWRLFAVSELAALSDEYYAADQIWRAVKGGASMASP